MKKLFILTSVLALGAVSSFAQGTINANNAGTSVNITIQDTTGVIANGVATKVGTPATAAGFVGAGPGQVTVYLYGAANGTSVTSLETAGNLLGQTNNVTATSPPPSQGTEALGSGFVLPTSNTFSGNQATEYIFYGVTANGAYGGWSGLATGITPATGTALAPNIFGTTAGLINSFNLVPLPEPSTIALGGLGAAALLLFRRRK